MNIGSCLTRQFDYCHEPVVGLVFCFFSVSTYTKLKMFAKTFSRTSLMTAVKKKSAYSAGDVGSIPGLGRAPREGNGNSLQYSCLGNGGGKRVRHDLATKQQQ